MKLSKAQRRFLNNAGRSTIIIVIDILGRISCDVSGFNKRTFTALAQGKAIENTRKTSFGPVGIFEYEITPAGRAALAEAEGRDAVV